jgi:hypothetical protein
MKLKIIRDETKPNKPIQTMVIHASVLKDEKCLEDILTSVVEIVKTHIQNQNQPTEESDAGTDPEN